MLTKVKDNKKKRRAPWDEYFMKIAIQAGTRSTCDRKHVGAVIVRQKTILSTGYNGSVRGMPHCDDVGHQMKRMLHEDDRITEHCVRTVHAEQNAICQAAKLGVSLCTSRWCTVDFLWLCRNSMGSSTGRM